MDNLTAKLSMKDLAGRDTQVLVALAFILNIVCYLTLPDGQTNLWKLLVQQCLILLLGTFGAKLDRLRPK